MVFLKFLFSYTAHVATPLISEGEFRKRARDVTVIK